jgi:hypothetical protein
VQDEIGRAFQAFVTANQPGMGITLALSSPAVVAKALPRVAMC